MIYLDTHVVVWLYAGEIKRLSEQARYLINNNEVLISPVVRLELQYLFEIQRITDEAKLIVSDLSDRIGLKICDENFNTIISNALNYSWTRDPFDRIIVANADITHNILITKDQNILNNYKRAVW
ncbi:MAG: PIN domain-containing protein [candidate division KSB1 bacterium]|nr:PIN domain-containing protein [candidate division KSB1 bacterium]MDZ7342702.1 PIN domain-containing protein [candidate division KSB1 bacterium]